MFPSFPSVCAINMFSRSGTRKLSWLNCFLLSHRPLQSVYSRPSLCSVISRNRSTVCFSFIFFQSFALIHLKVPERWFQSCLKHLKSLGYRNKIYTFMYLTIYRFLKSYSCDISAVYVRFRHL